MYRHADGGDLVGDEISIDGELGEKALENEPGLHDRLLLSSQSVEVE
jgi:hypothetical protein